MEVQTLTALFVAALLNCVAPGPCMFLTFGRAAAGGWRCGFAVSLGVLIGTMVIVGLALAVLKGLFSLSPMAPVVMKWVGIGLLLFLATRMTLARPAGRRETGTIADGRFDLVAGMMAGASSPFNLLFYLALFPQFLPDHSPEARAVGPLMITVFAAIVAGQAGAVLIALGSRELLRERVGLIEPLCAIFMVGTALVAAGLPAP